MGEGTERLYEGAPLIVEGDGGFEARVAEVRGREVVLDRTLFYPEGGGQPCDAGTLGGVEVVGVWEEGEEVVHVLGGEPGWGVGEYVTGCVDVERRRDHMEQHTGQHVLSAVLVRDHGVRTVGFHLGGEEVTVDVEGEVGGEVWASAEAAANRAIRDQLPIEARVVSGEAAAEVAAGLREPPKEAALRSPRGLRIVRIGGEEAPLDRDPCCGTHAASTGQLGALVVLGWERGRKGETRVRFVVGGRAVRAVRARVDTLSAAGRVLSAGALEVAERAEGVLEQLKAAQRGLKAARARVVALRAEALAGAGDRVVEVWREGEAGEAGALARGVVAARPSARAVVVHVGERLTVAVARGSEAPAWEVGEVVRGLVAPWGGRGGGRGESAQGSVADLGALEGVLEAARGSF